MFHIVIAEDESIIRHGLAHLLDWEQYNCEISFLAEDGEEALMYIANHPVDILITDIKMPKMSGLDLIMNAKEISSDIVTFIVSGYSDFEYAKTAIHYGVTGYLMKPIEEDQLRETLEKALAILKMRTQYTETQNSIIQIRDTNRRLRRENLFSTILLSDGQIPMLAEDLEVAQDDYYCVSLFEIPEEKRVSVKKIGETSNDSTDHMTIVDIQGNLMAAVIFDKTKEKVAEHLIWLRTLLNRDIVDSGIQLREGISDIQCGIEQIRDSLKKAAVNYNLQQESASLYHTSDNGIIDMRDKSDKIMSYVVNQKEGLSEYLELLEENLLMTEDQCIKNADALLSCVYAQIVNTLLNRVASVPVITLLKLHDLYERAVGAIDFQKKFQLLQEILFDVSDLMNTDRKGKWSKEINQSIIYIEKNYHKQNIDVGEIAEHVGMNPRYFSEVFKDKIGKSVMKYLIEYRIKIAKQLLLDTDLKAYQVAEMVGYDSYPYFSTLFQKNVGMSPSAYLEQMRGFDVREEADSLPERGQKTE